jgi:hypothetical protein
MEMLISNFGRFLIKINKFETWPLGSTYLEKMANLPVDHHGGHKLSPFSCWGKIKEYCKYMEKDG